MDSPVSGAVTLVSGSENNAEALFSYDPIQTVSGKNQFKLLENLKCWSEVKHMIENSTPIPDIAHYIQAVRKECISMKPHALKRLINSWVSSQANRASLVDRRVPVRHITMLQSMHSTERIDPIDMMNMLIAIQTDRILSIRETEKDKKSIDKDMRNEMRLGMDMVAKLADMQSEDRGFAHKLSSRQPSGSFEGNMDKTFQGMDRVKKIYSEKYGQESAEVVLNPDSRRKLFNIMTKIRKTTTETMVEIVQQNQNEVEKFSNQNTIDVGGKGNGSDSDEE